MGISGKMDVGYHIENVREEDLEEIWAIVCENKWKNYDIEDLRYIMFRLNAVTN